ncbi:MAG TPA: hypothetical protein EYP19_15875 [Desulfobacterales bacterium]|nr:hypothetical protein [Desulfobacterales bacterium]
MSCKHSNVKTFHGPYVSMRCPDCQQWVEGTITRWGRDLEATQPPPAAQVVRIRKRVTNRFLKTSKWIGPITTALMRYPDGVKRVDDGFTLVRLPDPDVEIIETLSDPVESPWNVALPVHPEEPCEVIREWRDLYGFFVQKLESGRYRITRFPAWMKNMELFGNRMPYKDPLTNRILEQNVTTFLWWRYQRGVLVLKHARRAREERGSDAFISGPWYVIPGHRWVLDVEGENLAL